MSLRKSLLVSLSLSLVLACGGQEPQGAQFDSQSDDLLSMNGLSTNGLSTNGLSTNGLSTNGLSTNGLNSLAFSTWFLLNTTLNDTVMRYIAKCALPSGQNLQVKLLGKTYTWPGNLGLLPGWSNNGPLDYNSQQLLSACLAAHLNKYGQNVNISVRAYDAWGNAVAVSQGEAQAYSVEEACFYGNLFDGSGIFAAYSTNSPLIVSGNTSLRACAADDGDWGNCSPAMSNAYSSAQQVCSGGSVSSGYWSCTHWGVSYRPVCVKLLPSQINACGDGICQSTESCWSPSQGTGCEADCGRCAR